MAGAPPRNADEETLRGCLVPDTGESEALDRILARLAAAEKVCELVKVSLSPKLRKASEKKTYWWDVAIAVDEWEKTRP